MTEDYERYPAFDATAGPLTPPPDVMQARDELFGGRPFRRRLLTYITLAILVVWPLTNLLIPADPGELLKEAGKAPIFFYISTMLFLWMIFALTYLTVWTENQSLLGVGLGQFRGMHLLWALAFFLASAMILVALENLLSALGYQPVGELELLLPNTTSQRIWWVALSFSAGFCEEIAFRGYLMTRIWRLAPSAWPSKYRWALAVLISSLIFGLGHTYQGVSGFVMITAYGVMIALLFLRTRSLWPCIFAHFLLDFYNLFVPFIENSGP